MTSLISAWECHFPPGMRQSKTEGSFITLNTYEIHRGVGLTVISQHQYLKMV